MPPNHTVPSQFLARFEYICRLTTRTRPTRCFYQRTAQPNLLRRGLHSQAGPKHKSNVHWATLASRSAVLVGLAAGSLQLFHETPVDRNQQKTVDTKVKTFRLAEVRQHDGSSQNPWVIRGTSVYDITDWVAAHPGGDVILTAAGGSIEPFWDIFTIHKRPDVYEILEEYKIGTVDEADLEDGRVPQGAIVDPFQNDPARDPQLITHTACPRNAETPQSALKDFITPNELFYVRNHFWVPDVKGEDHEITIEMVDGTERKYTVKELKERFPQHKITTTLQCAGNRRRSMTDAAGATKGLQWKVGAISTAEWEGVRLVDVLADAGLSPKDLPEDAQHVQFSAMEAYGASIPIRKAIDPWGDVLLAFSMNGAELPRDHGYPVRVVVPGTVAARSVKWLSQITISPDESPTQWQQRDYKSFCPSDVKNPPWERARSIQEMPVTSAITHVETPRGPEGERQTISAEGYAYSGGGARDHPVDGGQTWHEAELLDNQAQAKGSRAWCWKRWRYQGPTPAECSGSPEGKTRLVVKATDEAYNTQPQTHESIFNARGNLATAWDQAEVPT
ncbi:Sulfite oxidase [Penicillium diatomitis]|uniref:Nitrate reductase [NADPH] n=1 Tax=Penicillium diatomitis TaxID=2819901 RepID=A0A9W9XIJ4_9EURO|nr:Sulfite oxidase [Penicillium diatomitis]KAJ5493513.1 Sulfite oxidase [Penicillium diatomitis]